MENGQVEASQEMPAKYGSWQLREHYEYMRGGHGRLQNDFSSTYTILDRTAEWRNIRLMSYEQTGTVDLYGAKVFSMARERNYSMSGVARFNSVTMHAENIAEELEGGKLLRLWGDEEALSTIMLKKLAPVTFRSLSLATEEKMMLDWLGKILVCKFTRNETGLFRPEIYDTCKLFLEDYERLGSAMDRFNAENLPEFPNQKPSGTAR